jgi:hypothetical protein
MASDSRADAHLSEEGVGDKVASIPNERRGGHGMTPTRNSIPVVPITASSTRQRIHQLRVPGILSECVVDGAWLTTLNLYSRECSKRKNHDRFHRSPGLGWGGYADRRLCGCLL